MLPRGGPTTRASKLVPDLPDEAHLGTCGLGDRHPSALGGESGNTEAAPQSQARPVTERQPSGSGRKDEHTDVVGEGGVRRDVRNRQWCEHLGDLLARDAVPGLVPNHLGEIHGRHDCIGKRVPNRVGTGLVEQERQQGGSIKDDRGHRRLALPRGLAAPYV